MEYFGPAPKKVILEPLDCLKGVSFFHADGKARFHAYEYRAPAEDVDADYPLFFTSGRVVSQYLSGTQTRRIGGLVDQYPEPLCEIHPILAERFDIKDRDLVSCGLSPWRKLWCLLKWLDLYGQILYLFPIIGREKKSANLINQP